KDVRDNSLAGVGHEGTELACPRPGPLRLERQPCCLAKQLTGLRDGVGRNGTFRRCHISARSELHTPGASFRSGCAFGGVSHAAGWQMCCRKDQDAENTSFGSATHRTSPVMVNGGRRQRFACAKTSARVPGGP